MNDKLLLNESDYPSFALHLDDNPGTPGNRNDAAGGPADYTLNGASDEVVSLVIGGTAGNCDKDFVGMS